MQRTKYTHSRSMCVLWNCVMELCMQKIELTKKGLVCRIVHTLSAPQGGELVLQNDPPVFLCLPTMLTPSTSSLRRQPDYVADPTLYLEIHLEN
jgi:hypothetical protein